MAEEDLIWAKNQHMFGGIEPSNMLKFTLARINGRIHITAKLPNDTVINDQLLCTVGGAIIRRKTTDYPKNEFDGDFVANITESGTITDLTADANTVYYYAAFPYSTQGVYNRGYKNRAKYDFPDAQYYFGFDLDTTDSNPSTRVTYPSDVMNANYTPAVMKISSNIGTFDYGGWPSNAGEKFMPRPCVMQTNGTLKYYLNPNDYTKTIDGGDSDVGPFAMPGCNVMMEWPKIYTHREIVNGIYKFRCSDKKIGDDWDCWCNYDQNNNEIDHFYTGVYRGTYREDNQARLASLPGTIRNDNRTYYNDMVRLATNNGTDWYTDVLCDHLLITDLLIMMAKTTDLHTAYGKNAITGGLSGESNYHSFDKGMFYWGRVTIPSSGISYTEIKVFGMDYWFGMDDKQIAGLLSSKGNIKVKITRGTHDGTAVSDYNSTGVGYLTIGAVPVTPGTSGSIAYNGYLKENKIEPFGRIPIAIGGSLTTYDCAYFSCAVTSSESDIRFGEVNLLSCDIVGDMSSSYSSTSLSFKPRRRNA